MSFELDISPKDRAAARFIGAVRKALMKATLSTEGVGVTQQSIAEKLGVNRSVVNRMLKGEANLTLRSVAEIAWALGMQAEITLKKTSEIAVGRTSTGEQQTPVAIPSSSRKLSEQELSEFLKRGAVVAGHHAGRTNDNYALFEVAA
jgi:plasmid maintenance system antidote protein VapI